jgi:hypothetical protein
VSFPEAHLSALDSVQLSARDASDWALKAAERSLHGRMAAHALHARVADPSAHTAPARQAFLERFERQADPDGILSAAERARRAEHLRKAYFLRLSLKSAQARRKRRAA